MYCMLSSHMNNNSTKQKKIVTDSSKRLKATTINKNSYSQQQNILGISSRTPTAHFSHKYHYHNYVFTHLLYCTGVSTLLVFVYGECREFVIIFWYTGLQTISKTQIKTVEYLPLKCMRIYRDIMFLTIK